MEDLFGILRDLNGQQMNLQYRAFCCLLERSAKSRKLIFLVVEPFSLVSDGPLLLVFMLIILPRHSRQRLLALSRVCNGNEMLRVPLGAKFHCATLNARVARWLDGSDMFHESVGGVNRNL